MKKITTLFLLVSLSLLCLAGNLEIQADQYNQVFRGGGVSIGLYSGHFWSMKDQDQDDFMRLLYGECNTNYIQDYVGHYTTEKPDYFDKLANYVKMARKYRPHVELACVFNNFPDSINANKIVDGKEKIYLDVSRPDIYEAYADWIFEVCMGMHKRGVDVSIVNLVNEPDFNKDGRYGKFSNNKIAVAKLIENTWPFVEAMFADPIKNPDKVVVPDLMAPSCLATSATLSYITTFQNDFPNAWKHVDIVATHQYGGGTDWSAHANIKKKLDGRRFIQSEMHTNRGDDLGNLEQYISKEHRGIVSYAAVFITAVNNGLESWWYFQDNYPQTYHSGGLIQIPWGKRFVPYQTYYAFKQMNTIQGDSAHHVTSLLTNRNKLKASTFRQYNSNKVVSHVVNWAGTPESLTIKVLRQDGTPYPLKSIKVWQTDSVYTATEIETIELPANTSIATYQLPSYSLVSFEVTFEDDASGMESTESSSNLLKYNVHTQILTLDNPHLDVVSIYSMTGCLVKQFYGNKCDLNQLPPSVYVVEYKQDRLKIIIP